MTNAYLLINTASSIILFILCLVLFYVIVVKDFIDYVNKKFIEPIKHSINQKKLKREADNFIPYNLRENNND